MSSRGVRDTARPSQSPDRPAISRGPTVRENADRPCRSADRLRTLDRRRSAHLRYRSRSSAIRHRSLDLKIILVRRAESRSIAPERIAPRCIATDPAGAVAKSLIFVRAHYNATRALRQRPRQPSTRRRSHEPIVNARDRQDRV